MRASIHSTTAARLQGAATRYGLTMADILRKVEIAVRRHGVKDFPNPQTCTRADRVIVEAVGVQLADADRAIRWYLDKYDKGGTRAGMGPGDYTTAPDGRTIYIGPIPKDA